jgi:hypothetical protein
MSPGTLRVEPDDTLQFKQGYKEGFEAGKACLKKELKKELKQFEQLIKQLSDKEPYVTSSGTTYVGMQL